MRRRGAARPYRLMLPRITAAKTTLEVLAAMVAPRSQALKYHSRLLAVGTLKIQQRTARRLLPKTKERRSRSVLPYQGRVDSKTSSRF